MMQVFPIALVAAIMLHDSGIEFGPPMPLGTGLVAWLVGLLPPLLLGVIAVVGVGFCHRRLLRQAAPRWIGRADRIVSLTRLLLLVQAMAAVLWFGWLDAVRAVTGDLVLVDELIVLLPPLVGLWLTWWSVYPIDRTIRDLTLIRRLDDGLPVYPTLGRAAFATTQFRLHVLLLLIPVLLIVGLVETLDRSVGLMGLDIEPWALDIGRTGCAIAVLLLAPLVTFVVQDVQPFPAGPIRDVLTRTCRRHRVRVRNLMLWRTGGTMINAAVMGFFRQLRYVLMTDGLVQSMTAVQVEAVMAHEIGHVRRHHMPWLAITLIGLVSFVFFGLDLARWGIGYAMGEPLSTPPWFDAVEMIGGFVLVLWLFGWVSRRFERQADTFAVQHLSGLSRDGVVRPTPVVNPAPDAALDADGAPDAPGSTASPDEAPPVDTTSTDVDTAVSDADTTPDTATTAPVIDRDAVAIMQSTLTAISSLNATNPRRRSWRHGSIQWRVEYLATIAGRGLHDLAIDRQVRWIKRSLGGWLLAFLTLAILVETDVVRVPEVGPPAPTPEIWIHHDSTLNPVDRA